MKVTLAIIMAVFSTVSFAQANDTIYYSAKNYKVSKHDAEYYSVGERRNNKHWVGKVTSNYMSGEIRSNKTYDLKGKKEGEEQIFYKNGSIQQKTNYSEGKPTGNRLRFYQNGSMKSVSTYQLDEEGKRSSYVIKDFYDSLGNQTVFDGDGVAQYYHGNLVKKDSGSYLSSKKNGIWKGYHASGKLYYQENYVDDELSYGVSFDEEGNEFEYQTLEKAAETPDGLSGFYNYVANNMSYPTDARRNGTEGRVYIQFIVDRDGSVRDVKCVKGISSSCNKEAVRVISLSPYWNPALHRGQTMHQKIVMPIVFKLTDGSSSKNKKKRRW